MRGLRPSDATANAKSVVIVLAAEIRAGRSAGQPVAPAPPPTHSESNPRPDLHGVEPAATPADILELWIIAGQTPIRAGLLRPASDGAVQAIFTTPGDLTKAAAFAVTIEPDGGVLAPTGDKYLVGLVN